MRQAIVQRHIKMGVYNKQEVQVRMNWVESVAADASCRMRKNGSVIGRGAERCDNIARDPRITYVSLSASLSAHANMQYGRGGGAKENDSNQGDELHPTLKSGDTGGPCATHCPPLA